MVRRVSTCQHKAVPLKRLIHGSDAYTVPLMLVSYVQHVLKQARTDFAPADPISFPSSPRYSRDGAFLAAQAATASAPTSVSSLYDNSSSRTLGAVPLSASATAAAPSSCVSCPLRPPNVPYQRLQRCHGVEETGSRGCYAGWWW